MKFSLALVTVAGLLTSTFALPNPLPKPEVSTQAEIDANEIIPPHFNATEHNLSRRTVPGLNCYQFNPDYTFAVDGRYPIGELGKGHDLGGKNIYDVTKRYCRDVHGERVIDDYNWIGRVYWFKNALKTFPLPFAQVRMGVANDGIPGVINYNVCADRMAKVISGCIAQGGSSKLNHFRGGEFVDESGWCYAIYCDTKDCYKGKRSSP